MKNIIMNEYNLKEEEMTETVKRVKLLIINSNNEILLGYSHNEYQFPGGHVEEGESLIKAINREIKEETGMEFKIQTLNPFAISLGYYKDWPAVGKNRKIEIYYYEINTDEKPNLDNTEYTENEKDGNFELKYIPFDTIEAELKTNALKFGDNKGIAREMTELIKIYKNDKQFTKNMVQLLRMQLAIENFQDNTGITNKEIHNALLELGNLRNKREIMNESERIIMSEKLINMFNDIFDLLGRDKFIFYEDGDINYIWDTSLNNENK